MISSAHPARRLPPPPQSRVFNEEGTWSWCRGKCHLRALPDGTLVVKEPELVGFGSVHVVRDIGCTHTLVHAIERKEEIGQVRSDDLYLGIAIVPLPLKST
jgi:hypothetical protein